VRVGLTESGVEVVNGGLLDHLTEASHIVAGMGVTLDEALEMVRAAHEFAEQDEPTLAVIRTEGNVVYNVPFGAPRANHGVA
jgi:hypothetical protein